MNTSDAEIMEDGQLVSCVACSQQTVWLKHNKVQPMLAKLQSDVAKSYLEDNLLEEYGTNQHRAATVLIEESEVARHTVAGLSDEEAAGPLDVPSGPQPQFGQGACNEQMQGKNSTSYRG